ncbi:hypothetical protein [Lysinibacillus sp. C5.1]|uniref:hypothetical protein n=1 Tax=Lysinibacillus sp. C5.1 TaxID=2796169 RepID=UPI0030821AA6
MDINSERIKETMNLVDRLHLLNEKERSYVSGVVAALVFNKQLVREREKEVGQKAIS